MRVLLTGMSGVGKSALLRALKTPDNLTIDMDYDGWIEYSEAYGERAIDVERVLRLFADQSDREMILSGTAINQGKLYPHLDRVIVLTAPLEVMRRRILARADHSFGKSPQEWEQIMRDKEEVEPLLLRGCTHAIETADSIENTVMRIRECIKN